MLQRFANRDEKGARSLVNSYHLEPVKFPNAIPDKHVASFKKAMLAERVKSWKAQTLDKASVKAGFEEDVRALKSMLGTQVIRQDETVIRLLDAFEMHLDFDCTQIEENLATPSLSDIFKVLEELDEMEPEESSR